MNTLTSMMIDSPIGELTLIGSDDGLRAVLWPSERAGRVTFDEEVLEGTHPVLVEAAAQITDYITGSRTEFDLPLDPVGTNFQRSVWNGLSKIPFGETRSYGELASSLDRPGAARAVGAATGRNPISIVIPCHRLVGSNGKLTGFAGGLDAKRWLLEHETHSLF